MQSWSPIGHLGPQLCHSCVKLMVLSFGLYLQHSQNEAGIIMSMSAEALSIFCQASASDDSGKPLVTQEVLSFYARPDPAFLLMESIACVYLHMYVRRCVKSPRRSGCWPDTHRVCMRICHPHMDRVLPGYLAVRAVTGLMISYWLHCRRLALAMLTIQMPDILRTRA